MTTSWQKRKIFVRFTNVSWEEKNENPRLSANGICIQRSQSIRKYKKNKMLDLDIIS